MQLKIGVTGGIGSGKSLVVNTLEHLGGVVYHADARAKELVLRSDIRAQIIRLLGHEAYLSDGAYNRKYVASIVFSNSEKMKALNAIIHPAVFEDLDIFCHAHPLHTIVYESALMVETSHTHLFDIIILVTAPLDTRIERVMVRDHITREEVLHRMDNQWNDEQKRPFADYIIENISKEKTIQQTQEIWNKLHPNS